MKRRLSILLTLLISMLLFSACAKKTPVGPQSVTVNGVSLNYVEKGTGDEAIIFVHGYSGALGNWKHVLKLLPDEYHSYALDLRGFGQSGHPGSYKLTEIVEDIYAFSQELGIERFTYVGHSLGGKIGYKFALDHPDVLKAMFLIAPAPAHDFIPPEQQAGFIGQMTTVFGSQDMLRGFIAEDFVTPPSEEDINEFIHDVMAADPAAKAECAGWWVSTNLEPQLGDITVPTCIVAGAKDRLPLDWERRYADAIKGCRFEVLEDVGHMMPYESPQKLVDLLTGFIKDVNK
ncbi:alpha/beta fold hydrolase [Acidobacteriota bacterium]